MDHRHTITIEQHVNTVFESIRPDHWLEPDVRISLARLVANVSHAVSNVAAKRATRCFQAMQCSHYQCFLALIRSLTSPMFAEGVSRVDVSFNMVEGSNLGGNSLTDTW